jgi:hypothetical protein
MADDRSLWALRRTTQAGRRDEDAPQHSGAVDDARRALEWMRVRLEQLREERNSNPCPNVTAVGQSARATHPRRNPRALR